jgi:hypothetical protein
MMVLGVLFCRQYYQRIIEQIRRLVMTVIQSIRGPKGCRRVLLWEKSKSRQENLVGS